MAQNETQTHSDLFGNKGKGASPEVALVLTTDDAGGTLPFFTKISSQVFFIGREPVGGGLALPVPSVSRTHAQISRQGETYQIKDLNSRNGVFVDGRRVTEATLNPWSVVRLGDVVFVFVTGPLAPYESFDPTKRAITHNGLELICGPLMADLERQVRQIASSHLPVLVRGETGSGKDGVAKALHKLGGLPGKLHSLNCAAIPPQLVESELFGHVKGTFTSATEPYEGGFRIANKGTLVLDEVSDLPLDSQAKLLRVLETKQVTPVGSTEAIPVDVRVIATTHRDLRGMATAGLFRGDLFARLNGFQLNVPPLRHRKEDIQWLLRQVIGEAFTFRFLYGLVLYDWPFNVRELLSVVTAAKLAAGSNPLDYEHLPPVIRSHVEALQVAAPTVAVPMTDAQVGVKKQPRPSEESLREVLVREKGNVAALARHFDRDRALIHRWLKDAGLNPDEFRQDA